MVNNIIGHWKLDEAGGSTAVDSTTNHNDGYIVGTSVGPGLLGSARVFYQGTPNRVHIGTSDLFNFTDKQFSISVWFKKGTVPAQSQGIISKWYEPTANKCWRLVVKSDNTISFDVSIDGSAESATVTYPLSLLDNEWHLLTITRNGTWYKLYVDGAIASTYIFGPASLPYSYAPLAIGNYCGTSVWNNAFDGYIDNVKIFNYALDDLDAANLYYDFGYDSSPPWFIPVNPTPGQIRISPDTDVVFKYIDEHADLDTLNVNFNGQFVLLAGMAYDGYSVSYEQIFDGYSDGYDGYTATISGENLLPERTEIVVAITAADAYGTIGTYSYSFWTSSSYDPPPKFVNFNPLPGTVGLIPTTPLFFQINDGYDIGVDLISGINLSTLHVDINGVRVIDDGAPTTGYSATIVSNIYSGYDVTITKDSGWPLARTLFVSMDCMDNNGSRSDYSYSVKLGGGPIITDVSPIDLSEQVANNEQVTFSFFDAMYGINKEDLNVTINGQAAVVNSVAVNGHAVAYNYYYDGYGVVLSHPNWAEHSNVSVEINVLNRMSVPASYSFSFQTADVSAPIVDQLNPDNGEEIINLLTNIEFRVRDLKSGVNGETLNATLNGANMILNGNQQPGYTVNITNVTDGYFISIDKATAFPIATTFVVYISVKDYENNLTERTYSFVTLDLSSPVFMNLVPQNLDIDVPTSTNIGFSVYDFMQSGIDLATLDVTIAGDAAVVDGLQQDGYILETTYRSYDGYVGFDGYDGYDGYDVNITLPFSLPEYVTISVDLHGCNNNGNCSTRHFSFITADETAPQLTAFSPPYPGPKVGFTEPISFNIIEPLSGINFSTLNIAINGIDVYINGEQQDIGYTATIVPIIGGVNVSIVCTGPQQHPEFMLVPVHISVYDYSDNFTSTTFYFHTIDVTVPFFDNFSPANGAIRANINTNFAFDFKDIHSGPDTSTLQLAINAVPVIINGAGIDSNVVTYSPIADGYRVDVDLSYSLPEYRIITAELDGYDKDPNFAHTAIYFSTDDITPPVLTNISPPNGSIEINPYTHLFFDLYDFDGAGLDFTSTDIQIDGQDAIINGIEQSGWTVLLTAIVADGYDGYNIEIVSDHRFQLDSDINVNIGAADAYGNTLSQAFSFHTFKDVVSPYIEAINPLASETEISVYSNIVFSIRDGYDVDISRLDAYVDGNLAILHGVFQTGYDGPAALVEQIIDGYRITIDPTVRFEYNHTTGVHIDGYDFSNNYGWVDYVFYTTTDANVPVVSNRIPDAGAIEVAINSMVSFDIADNISDIDLYNLDVYIDGNQTIIDGIYQSGWYGTMSSVSRITDGYHVVIDPTGSNEFDYNEIHTVSIDGYDYAHNHTNDTYSFATIVDTHIPIISNLVPNNGDIEIPIATNIAFSITDNISGIDLSQLKVWINGIPAFMGGAIVAPFTDINNSVMTIADGYRITFDPYVYFGYNQLVTIIIDGYDHADNENYYTYSFVTKVDIDGPTVIPVSPLNGVIDYPRESNVSLMIKDYETGVDMSRTDVFFNNTLVLHGYSFSDGYNDAASIVTQIADGYAINIDQNVKLPAGILVVVTVDGYDFVNNHTHYEYVFYTIDDAPPYIFDFVPNIVSVNVVTDPLDMSFGIRDEGGNIVDLSTLVVEASANAGEQYSVIFEPTKEFAYGWAGNIFNQPGGDGYILTFAKAGIQDSFRLYTIKITAADNLGNYSTTIIGKSGGLIANGTGTISGAYRITVGTQFITDNGVSTNDILLINGINAFVVDGYDSGDIITKTPISGSGAKDIVLYRGSFLTQRRIFEPLTAIPINEKDIIVTFSSPISNIGYGSSYVISGGTHNLNVISVSSYSDRSVKISTDGMEPLVEYLLEINTNNVLDLWGFSIDDGYEQIGFTGFPDIDLPQVIEAKVAPFNINITVIFDDDMLQDEDLLNPANYRLNYGAYVTRIDVDPAKKDRVVLTVERLYGRETFDLYVSTSVKDKFSNNLDIRFNHAQVKLNITGAGFSGISGKLKTRDEVNRLYEDNKYWYIATSGGFDIMRKVDLENEGFVLDGYGTNAITADSQYIYFDSHEATHDAYQEMVYRLAFADLHENSTERIESAYAYPIIQTNNVNDLFAGEYAETNILAIATNLGATIIFGANIMHCADGYHVGSIAIDDSGTKLYLANNTLGRVEVYYNLHLAPSGTIYPDATYDILSIAPIIHQIKVTFNTSQINSASNTIYVATSSTLVKIETDESVFGMSEGNGLIYTYGVSGSGASYEVLGGTTNNVIAVDINMPRLQALILTNDEYGAGGLTTINLPSNTRFSYSSYENGTLISNRLRDVVAKN